MTGKLPLSSDLAGRTRAALPWLPLLAAASVAAASVLGAWLAASRYAQRDTEARFERQLDAIEASVRGEMDNHLKLLRGARAFFDASRRVSRQEFIRFADGTGLSGDGSSVFGIGFIERVEPGDIERFHRSAQLDNAFFAIRGWAVEGDPPPDHRIVRYMEPAERNADAVGFDVGVRPEARAAMDVAAATGEPAMTGALRLVQEPADGLGSAIYLPVYVRQHLLNTPEARAAATRGWVCLVLRYEDLGRLIEGFAPRSVHVQLIDATDPGRPRPLHAPAVAAHEEADHPITGERRFVVAGRSWALRAHADRGFLTATEWLAPIVAPIGAAVLGAATLVITWSLTTTGRRARDLAERMTRSLRVAEAEARKLAAVASRTSNAVVITDAAGRIDWVNDGFTRITGHTLDEVRGHKPGPLLQGADTDRETVTYMGRCIREGRGFNVRILNYGKQGRPYWVAIESQPLHDEQGKLTGFMSIETDITAQKLAEDELRRAAETDRLTGLLNREQMLHRIDRAIRRRQADNRRSFALLFLDFDRFKIINDSLGHQAGDRLLVEVAKRLRAEVERLAHERPGRLDASVGRAGGDEFTILLDGMGDTGEVCAFADSLIAALASPYELDEHEVHFAASIGITTGGMEYAGADAVLRDADTAMYAAKAAGHAGYVVFDAKMHEAVAAKLRMESLLRKALARNELFLVYQPIVSLETGELQGFESLMRWKSAELGFVSPADFIPVAEESGLILPIGEWALREACAQLARWRTELHGAHRLRMNVNLSRRQLLQPNLPEVVSRVLKETSLPPHALHLEITESMLMENAAAASSTLARLKALGVRLAMDDFGTGYSSLSYLHQFPLTGLKIDRSFVGRMTERRDFIAIVQAIIALAHSLGVKVTAEGIENEEQLVQLQALECDDAQGYHFAKPLPAADAQAYIVRHLALAKSA